MSDVADVPVSVAESQQCPPLCRVTFLAGIVVPTCTEGPNGTLCVDVRAVVPTCRDTQLALVSTGDESASYLLVWRAAKAMFVLEKLSD